ncbi:DUF4907 domain-containing protein [Terrimonas pollutisoli]|uniref:DUF4907 domain-containing protein n=1 Tax=Terrimonas pollutisoli TaxID=3034147 RepID=UPI0023EDFADE|nr:DUF4907 domain-containing protein [Terrimonas sp. H1YJ31]
MLLAVIIFVVTINQSTNKKKNHISATVFEGTHGWGYDILVNDELFIHQELIPALQGQTGFQTKIQAEQTARLIINKMKGGQLPTVTTFELEPILSLNKTQHDQPGTAK